MPNWKKVLTSGSAGELASLYAPSITGSLLGTASFATSASFLTSNTNAFIQGGNSFGTTALLGTNDTQNLQFETNGLVRMTVSSSGNVGIGTSAPSRLLSVNGVFGVQFSNTTESFAVNPTSTGVDFVIKNASNPSLGEFRVDTRTGQRFAYYNGGNFAIGTQADDGINKLQVVGSAIITGSTSTDLVRITQTGTGNAFVVEDSTNPDSSPFVIDNTGEVGIGTSSPTRILHTTGSTNGISVPLFEGMAISETRFLTIKRTDGSAEAFINYTGADLAFGANGIERLRIGRYGDIAIGTTSSAAGARLYLTGNDDGNIIRTTPLLIASASANTDLVRFTQTGTGNSFVVEDTNTPDSSQFVIDNVGNVGIGTTTPNSKLEVNGNTNITGSLTVSAGGVNGILLDTDTSVGNSQRSARMLFGQQDPTKSTSISAISGSMYFATSASFNVTTGQTRMFISESGDIGIGTTTPNARLTITTPDANINHLTLNRADTNNSWFVNLAGNDFRLWNNSGSGADVLLGISSNSVDVGNRVGIGTSTPNAKLDVSGSAIITGSLTVSAGITGSLLGTASTASYVTLAQTASYFSGSISNATNAVSASYALTASYVNPLNQNVVVTGSLTVTGSINSYDNITLLQNATYLQGKNSSNVTTRIIGINSSNLLYIGSVDAAISSIFFNINGSNLLQISSSGDVGLGKSNPTAKLDINGNTIITGSLTVTQGITGSGLQITGSTSTDLVRITQTGTGNAFVVEDSTNPDTSPFIINASGSVGIGNSTPQSGFILDVLGNSVLRGQLYVNGPLVEFGSSSYKLSTVGTSWINSGSGNLGIGTTTPNAKLDVNGNTIITGSLNVTQGITGSRLLLSASTGTNSGSVLTVYGSGSAQPVFIVQGSQGELFSVTDSLSGSLFSVNDISGLPILEVFSDNTTLIGSYQDPMLITTTKLVTTASGAFTIYSLPTASYDTAFYEYSIRSGSNARAGSIMAIQSGSMVNFTETTTTDFGSTSGLAFTVLISGANMLLTGSATTSGWTLKTIIRSI